MAVLLKPSSTTSEINWFLNQLSIPNWRVHPRVVEFNNAKDRNKKMTLLHNKLVHEGLPIDAAQSQVNELKEADILSIGIKSLKQSGSVLMLCGDWEKDLEQAKSSEEAVKHIVLLFLKDQKVSIPLYPHFQFFN